MIITDESDTVATRKGLLGTAKPIGTTIVVVRDVVYAMIYNRLIIL